MSAPGVPAGTIKYLGKEAARRYLDENVPLNDSIEKQAVEHGLNAHHIRRVSEAANHAVHATLYDNDQASKNVEFTLARPESVISKLGAMVKTASGMGPVPVERVRDYDAPPDAGWARHEPEFAKLATSGQGVPDWVGMGKTKKQKVDTPQPSGQPATQVIGQSGKSTALKPKLASTPEERADCRTLRKVAALAKEARRLAVTAESHRDIYFETLVKQASRHLDAGDSFADVHTALAAGRPDHPETPGVIAKLAKTLYERGKLAHADVAKAASMMADPAFVSQNMGPARTVNGNLSLLKTLDQVVFKAREAERNRTTYDRLCPDDQIVLRAVEL